MGGTVSLSAATVYLTSFSRPPFVPAPRDYSGNMCGTYLDGLPPIPGGAPDPRLVISWLVFYYSSENRQRIYADHKRKGLLDFLVSWPDFEASGGTPQGFRDHCLEVRRAGLRPCAFLSAKPTSSANIRTVAETLANILSVLPLLVGIVPRFCVGWELSLWLSPADVWFLTWNIAPIWLKQKGTLGYVHFQEGYFAYQFDGHDTASYWWMNRGLLHGILFQRSFSQSPDFSSFQARLEDGLVRFAGQFNYPIDNGIDGLPFLDTALEITAMAAFWNGMSEADQDAWARAAIETPAAHGPLGPIAVAGAGNGVA